MLPTAVETIIASISRFARSVGLSSVAAGVFVTMPISASAQGQPPADGCGGQWIYGPGQDDRQLTTTQLGGSEQTTRAVEWDPDGRTGPEKPWLVVMTNAMRPFAWDGERWRALPPVSETATSPFVDARMFVFRDDLYAFSPTGTPGLVKLVGSEWIAPFSSDRNVTAAEVENDQLLLADVAVSGLGDRRVLSWDGTTLTTLATGLGPPAGAGTGAPSSGGISTIARWNGDLYVGGYWLVYTPAPNGSFTSRPANFGRVVPGSGVTPGTFETLTVSGRPPNSSVSGVMRFVSTDDLLLSVVGNAISRSTFAWNGTSWREDGFGEPFRLASGVYRLGRLTTTAGQPTVLQQLVGQAWIEAGPRNRYPRESIGAFGRELIQRRMNDGSSPQGVFWTSIDDGMTRKWDVGSSTSSFQNPFGWRRVVPDEHRAVFSGLSRSDVPEFTGPQGVASVQVSTFDGYEWRALGPAMTTLASGNVYGSANDLLVDGSLLYAATGNRFVGTTQINGIGAWDGQAWQSLGDGLSLVGTGTFLASRAVLFEGDLIVSGRFDRAGGRVVSNVARWDGSQWWPMGELPGSSNFAVLNGKLYAMSDALYRWDGLAWTRLGRTFPFGAFDLKVWRGELYAAGTFTQVGGEPLPYIAVFRGGDWQALAVPLQQIGQVGTAGLSSLEPTADGLLAHGRFALPGETEIRPRIAKWTGTAWEPVVSGLPTDAGFMTASTRLGNERIVAGSFVNINGQRSTNYARWSPDGRPWIAQPPRSATSSIGGSVDFKAEAATGYTGLVFKWLRNREELADGTTAAGSSVLGANTRWLTVSNLQAADAGSYVLRISNPCGQSLSTAATLTLRCSASDVAGANQSIGSDGVLTADDIIVYLSWFFAGDTRADVAGPNQSTTPDGNLTADDIIVFLGRFFAGC